MKFGFSKQAPREPAETPRRRPARSDQHRMTPFGYYSGNVQRTSAEQLERSKTARNAPPVRHRLEGLWGLLKTRFGVVLALLAVLVFGVNMLRLSPDVAVESMNAAGTGYALHDAQTYRSAAEDLLKKSVFNKNKLTVNTSAVEKGLMEQFPELTNVSVAIPLVSHRPVVYIRIAEPSFILVTEAGQSFVVDESGRALAVTTQIHNLDALRLPVIQDESGLNLNRGDIVLPASASQFVREVVHQFAAKHIDISRMRLPPASSELDVYPKGAGYYVKFNLQNDTAAQQTGTYLAVIQELHKQGKTPKKYIDVRIDGRAYYK
ncbi:MAG TPA: hypothetical protein VFL85_04040 [Candidatus Saccharimonadales bacterium]|nr:hypothetical protein [Candidatus Saccharimonadales bacterium]